MKKYSSHSLSYELFSKAAIKEQENKYFFGTYAKHLIIYITFTLEKISSKEVESLVLSHAEPITNHLQIITCKA